MTTLDLKALGKGRIGFAVYLFVRNFLLFLSAIFLRLSCSGREHVPKSGAYVMAAVHRSNLDIIVISTTTRRRQRYMGKDTLWKKQPFNWLLSALGGFPVTRGSIDRLALQRCLEVVKGGEPLVLYPEGTRLSGPTVGPLFEGVAYVATKCGVPVIPVGIAGTERAMGKGSKGIRPTKVHVEIGPAIMPPVAIDGGRVSRDVMHQLTEQLQAELQRLFDIADTKVAGGQSRK